MSREMVVKLRFFVFRSKEEKDKEKAASAALIEEYGFCTMDGHKEKIGNFRSLPPLKIMFLNHCFLQN